MEADKEIYVPPNGPPQNIRPNPAIYQTMGEQNIFKMLEDLYAAIGDSPIRELFPEDLVAASRKSAAFFITLCGGPPMYQQLYGPPMMRRRHIPFRIDESARQEWLKCFQNVLENAEEKYDFPAEHMDGFKLFLEGFSGWMINTK